MINVELPPPELESHVNVLRASLSQLHFDYLRHPRGVVLCIIVTGTRRIVVVVYAAIRSRTRLMGTLFLVVVLIIFLVSGLSRV